MGMGHVPKDPIHPAGESAELQGRQRGGTPSRRSHRTHAIEVPSSSIQAARARGRWAEDLVARWYQRQGFEILARNWRINNGELDVVARQGNLVVVCEVKARATNAYGTPAEAMTARKQFVVRRAAYSFLRDNQLQNCVLRCDVACVVGKQLEVLIDSF